MKGKRHHTIITGTGRAGTTFLVELMTRLGLETGFSADKLKINKRAFAGLERNLRKRTAPYIAKDPGGCHYLAELLDSGNVVIDHAIVPIRDFAAAAQSRIRISEIAAAKGEKRASGGLWMTDDPEQQLPVLYEQFSELMATLARHDVPVTWMWYPRLTRDAEYTYRKLAFLIPEMDFEAFSAVFNETVRPARVHKLSDRDD